MCYADPLEEHNGGELEFMLENERKKFKESKDKMEQELDNERKLRIEFENKLIKLKEEFSRKDVGLSELEFKINSLLHQNQDISVENDRLKHELARLEELYGGKIHELESQLEMEGRNFEETTMQYNGEFEKFKQEGQDYVEQLTFEFERKAKSLDEKGKQLELVRKVLLPRARTSAWRTRSSTTSSSATNSTPRRRSATSRTAAATRRSSAPSSSCVPSSRNSRWSRRAKKS